MPPPKRPNRHYVIYIPGLGDYHVRGQRIAVSLWRLQGFRPVLYQMNWADGEDFSSKFERLLDLVDSLHDNGKNRVSLVAASAGASAAINTFAARTQMVNGVVCICGKILHQETVSQATYDYNPAFKQSMQRLQTSLDGLGNDARARIVSMHPVMDHVVPVRDTLLPGAVIDTLASSGHAVSIGLAITVYSAKVLNHLKKLARN